MSEKFEKKVLFKEVFKGYSKEEVTAYIDSMSTQFSERENELKVQLERSGRQSLDDGRTIMQLKEQIAALEEAAREAKALPAAVMNGAAEAPSTEVSVKEAAPVQPDPRVAELEGELAAREIYIGEMNEKLRSLEEQIAELAAVPPSKEPGELYEEISRKMGRMIFSAEQTSKELLESSREKSAEIIRAAEENARRLHEQANAQLTDKTAVNRALLEESRIKLDEFLTRARELSRESGEALKRCTESYNAYNDIIGELTLLSESQR